MGAGEPAPATLLDQGLAELGIALESRARQQLLDLASLLATWAQRFNLTAHRSAAAVLGRLVLDALALERVLPAAGRIADLGSGAGFPGLPLAVVRPQTQLVLVEARERRHHFQRTALRELGLRNATALRGRIEALEPVVSEGVIAQAVAQPAVAAELALPWCSPGGWIGVPGAEAPPEPGPVEGLGVPEVRRYQVPAGGPGRTLWLAWRRPAAGG